jgi:hypothetical protein
MKWDGWIRDEEEREEEEKSEEDCFRCSFGGTTVE